MARPNKNYEPKKEVLIKLAFDLFIEQGYENTTITQIMKKAGLTKAGMYHYFSSKEEILDATIHYGITQDIEKTQEYLKGLSTERKMIHFIQGNTAPNEFFLKLSQIKQNNQSSYAAYRIREQLVHAYIPVMEEILKEGVEKGIYKTEYVRPAAEFMVLYGKALVEPNILPAADHEESILRMRAFLQLVDVWFRPTPEHMADIIAIIERTISELGEARGMEKNETD